MPVVELWACDVCNPDGCDGPCENEDEARDTGWVEFQRSQVRETVFAAIPGTTVKELRLPARTHHDRMVVCPSCAEKEGPRLRAEGWSGGLPVEGSE